MSAPSLKHIAIVGAGPVGLSAALLLARALPATHISLFDSRPADADLSQDRRTLALALGTTQLIERVASLAGTQTQAIARMEVSDAAPLPWPVSALAQANTLELDAAESQLPALGTVVAQGNLTAALQTEWLRAVAAEPARLFNQLGHTIKGYRLMTNAQGEAEVELDGEVVHSASMLVVAEGLAAQTLAGSAEAAGAAPFMARALAADYAQTAWVGTVELAHSLNGTAVQRFTPAGPLTLLPADAVHGPNMAAVVACVPATTTPQGDPLLALDDSQRIAALNTWLSPAAAAVQRIGYLKPYPLSLTARKSLVNWGASGTPPGGGAPARVVHIGAAAQSTYPLLASAIDMGLRDAYELSAKLSAVTAHHSTDAALRNWELGRTPERWGLIALTDLAARTSSASNLTLPGVGNLVSGVVGSLRGAGLAALNAAGPVKRALVQQVVFGSRSS